MTDTVNIESLQAQLEQALAENRSLKNSKEKFGLTFKRHAEQGEAQLLRKGQIPFLIKDDELSVIKEEPQSSDHLLIEGDNLSALVMMQATHKGKVDVIYIDPPYNTGEKDFVYNDKFVSNDDGFRHSKWLSFMERRLVLAKELLSETGVIFVSIDDNEQAPLKMLMDSVFGEQNFITSIIWEKTGSTRNDAKFFSISHEYILLYHKGAWNRNLLPRTEDNNKNYKHDDLDGRGLYSYGDLSVARITESSIYPISNPNTGKAFLPPKGRSWGVSKESYESLLKDKRISFSRGGLGQPTRKRYLSEVQNGIVPSTLFVAKDFGETNKGTREVKSILGGGVFTYPKPTSLLNAIIQIASKKDAIILDFFAGSGTTGHAVAQLNAEDGGNRQCILVTNNFEEDGSPNGIARDVTAKRMKAVLTGEWADGKDRDPLPGNFHYYQVQFRDRLDDLSEAWEWGDGRYDGIAALTNNAHSTLPPSALGDGKLANFINNGQANVVFSNEEAILVWASYEALTMDEEEVEEAISEFLTYANDSGVKPKFLVTSESADSEEIPSGYLFARSSSQAFPVPYLSKVEAAVKPLIAQGMLDPLAGENKEDELDVQTYD